MTPLFSGTVDKEVLT